MVETHFFHYHLPLSSQISDMETFGYGFLSCTSPPLLLFHANNSNLLLTCLGLHFWFGSLFLGLGLFLGLDLCLCLGLCVKHQGNIWQKPMSAATTGGRRSPPFSILFFSPPLLVWFFVCLGLGQFVDWVFLCDIRIWWFFIWVSKGVWVWSFTNL